MDLANLGQILYKDISAIIEHGRREIVLLATCGTMLQIPEAKLFCLDEAACGQIGCDECVRLFIAKHMNEKRLLMHKFQRSSGISSARQYFRDSISSVQRQANRFVNQFGYNQMIA